MMMIRAVMDFYDYSLNITKQSGEVFECDDSIAESLVKCGVCALAEQDAEQPKTARKTRKKAE